MTLIHPKIRPIYLELIEDTQAIFHILVCVIKEENYLLINIYSDPDTDANAEATMNRVLDWMEDVKKKIHDSPHSDGC